MPGGRRRERLRERERDDGCLTGLTVRAEMISGRMWELSMLQQLHSAPRHRTIPTPLRARYVTMTTITFSLSPEHVSLGPTSRVVFVGGGGVGELPPHWI